MTHAMTPSATAFSDDALPLSTRATEGVNHALKITTDKKQANIWDWQIHYKLDKALTVGKTYTLTMRIKGSDAGIMALWPIDTAQPLQESAANGIPRHPLSAVREQD